MVGSRKQLADTKQAHHDVRDRRSRIALSA
jgi:hypothetical protein